MKYYDAFLVKRFKVISLANHFSTALQFSTQVSIPKPWLHGMKMLIPGMDKELDTDYIIAIAIPELLF